jgi:fibronectin-binding autotransporter adhesin
MVKPEILTRQVDLSDLRAALLASAAVAALFLAAAPPAEARPDRCTYNSPTEVTCSGDQSQGVIYGFYVAKVTVQDLVKDIDAPIFAGGVVVINQMQPTVEIDAALAPYRIITTGDDQPGIYAQGIYNVKITSVGDIATSGRNSEAIRGRGQLGRTDIDSQGNLSTTGDNAYGILAYGYTGVSVVSYGSISTAGAGSHAIYAFNQRQSIAITIDSTGDLTTNGNASSGVRVNSAGSADVKSNGSITTMGTGSFGMRIDAATGPASAYNKGDITTHGDSAPGISVHAAQDATVRIIGNIVTGGTNSHGVVARSYNADVSITSSGNIETLGGSAHGIDATADHGAVSIVNHAGIQTSGVDAVAIAANAATSANATNTGDITTSGDLGRAISVTGGSSATVENHGKLSTNGTYADGIYAASSGGSVSVYSSSDIDIGGEFAHGINAQSSGGGIEVTNTGAITTHGTAADAILALSMSTSGAVQIANSAALLETTGERANAINAYGNGDIAITSSGKIATAGIDGRGITARSEHGAVTVQNDSSIVTGGASGGYGILVYGQLGGRVTSTGDITVAGRAAYGIRAESSVGDAAIANSGRIATHGDTAPAIAARVRNDGNATVDNAGVIATDGQQSSGIIARSPRGNAEIVNSADVSTLGNAAAGLVALSTFGDVAIDSNGDVETTGTAADGVHAEVMADGALGVKTTGMIGTIGDRSDGIDAIGRGGGATLDNGAAISTTGTYASGIELRVFGDGMAAITSHADITTRGAYSAGIRAAAYDGASLTVANVGDIATAGSAAPGIWIGSFGSGNVALSSIGDVTVAGNGGHLHGYGLAAVALAGDSEVASVGNVLVAGDHVTGIAASGVNAGARSEGNVTVLGDFSIGVLASASNSAAGTGAGAAKLASAGDVAATGVDSTGLYARSLSGAAEITVSSGVVTGGSGSGAGVDVFAASGATIENHGTIRSVNDRAIFNGTGSGPLAVDNFGTVIGFVDLNDGADDFNNRGQFLARGDSDFGAGRDSFTNAGTLRLADGVNLASFRALETFSNGPSGVITMINGKAGDRLSFPALTNFHGGGVVGVDAALAGTGSPADLLTVSGVVSGTTAVVVNNVARSPGVRGAEDIFIIDQGSRPKGDEFRLAGGPINVGFLFYDLRPDDDGSTRWELYETGLDQARVDSLGAVVTGLQNVWHAGVNAWHQRMGDLVSLASAAAETPGAASAPALRGGVWMRGFGEDAGYDPDSSADFHQDVAGAQGGIDGVAAGPLGGDSVIAGLLGGYVQSGLTLDHAPDEAVYEGGAAGGYLAYLNSGFHADLLLKADLVTVTYQQGGLSEDFAARSLGGSIELGYKYDLGRGYYLNPLAQLAYVSGDIDDGWLGVAPVSFADGSSLRSRAGLRAGFLGEAAGAAVEPYVEAHILHEFAGSNRGFVYGSASTSNALDSWGLVGGGIQVTAARFTAFVNLQALVGAEIDGLAGQGGIRWSF